MTQNKVSIISEVMGGLGNQMFQYAAGFSLATKKKYKHELDVTSFDYYSRHQGFELFNVFNCNSSIATKKEIRTLTSWRYDLFRKYLPNSKIALLLIPNSVVREPYSYYWSGIQGLPDKSYLSGYWQSEKYFEAVENKLRQEFTFCLPLTGENLTIYEKIEENNSVSLHIRRGDYVSDPKANKLHGVCSISYYQRAIKYLSQQLHKPIFFVFSDDMEWVKKNLRLVGDFEYIEHNTASDSHYDMQLMSHCKHHVIANSSFSWWGAWLCKNPKQQVVAPKSWFADPTKNINDILPIHWIRL